MKRVLVISYYWPPAGGVSVLRSLKIVKYLREFGWEPVVYKPSNAHYPYLDEGGTTDVPPDLEIIEYPIVEPFRLFKKFTGRSNNDSLNNITNIQDSKSSWKDKLGIWVRGNFFIPDARSLWIRPSVRILSKYILENPIDAIFTDGPPHTNTYIGYRLSRKHSIPWLADFQDPWTQIDYYKLMSISPIADGIHKRMEQKCLKQASKITIASPSWKRDLESIGAKNVDVIYYGYDESDFSHISKKESSEFKIVHIGLLGKDRDPFFAIKTIANEVNDRMVVLQLAGQVDHDVLNQFKLIENLKVENLGPIPRKLALQMAMNADLLLLPINKADNSLGRLPGKLYEYLRTQNLILALGPTHCDAAEIIKKTNTGYCLDYEDEEGLRNFVINTIKSKNKRHVNFTVISSYSNYNQTGKVAKYLDQIT